MLTMSLSGPVLIALAMIGKAAPPPVANAGLPVVAALASVRVAAIVRLRVMMLPMPARVMPASAIGPALRLSRARSALDRAPLRDILVGERFEQASLRALRLDPPRRSGRSPLDTRLTLTLSGDAHSMNADVGVTGAIAKVVRHAIGE